MKRIVWSIIFLMWFSHGLIAQTPIAGTISATANSICSGSNTTLTYSGTTNSNGNTIIWQKSSTQTGPYSDIVDATNNSFTTANLTSSEYYKVKSTETSNSAVVYSTPFFVEVTPLPNVALTSSPTSISSTGTIAVVTATGAQSFTWTPSGGTASGNGSGTYSINLSTNTVITATGTDGNGCINSNTISLSVLSPGSIGNDANVCEGSAPSSISEITGASGGLSSGYTYQWQESNDASFSNITVVGSNSPTLSVPTPFTSTKYYRRGVKDASDPGSTYVYTNTVQRTYRSLPVLTISQSPSTSVNPNTSVTLAASLSDNTRTYTYSWSTGSSLSSITVAPSITTPYDLTVTDQFSCVVSGSKSVVVSALQSGSISVSPADYQICSGQVPSSISGSQPTGGTGSGYTYQWQRSINGGTWVNLQGQTTANYTPTERIYQSTSFRRIVYNDGVSATSNVVTFNIDPLPTAVVTSNRNTVAPQGSATLSISGGDYLWYSASNQTSASITVTPSVTTTYFVRLTDANGCIDTGSFTVNVVSVNPGSISGQESICLGGALTTISSVQSPSGGSGNYTYTWQVANNLAFTGATTIQNETGATLSLANPTSAGTLYYRRGVIDAAGPNTPVYSVAISKTVNALPAAAITASNSTIPAGASVTLTATLGSGNTYQWNTGATTNPITVNPTQTTDYTVTVTNASGCQATSSPVTRVTVDPLLAGTITSSDFTVCSGSVPGTITSSALPSGGTGSNYSYTWESSTNLSTWSVIPNATASSFSPTQAITQTTYFRRRVTNLGISNVTSEVTFTIDALPTSISASANPSIVAPGGLSTLSVAQTYSNYSWNTTPVQTGQSISVSVPSGGQSYIVTVTDQNGCQNTATVTVTTAAIDPGTIQFTGGGTSINRCVGQALPIIAEATQATGGGNGNYVYNWQSSTDNVTFTDVAGATGTTLTLATQQTAQTVYYKRGVRDANAQTSAIVYTPAVTLNVRALPTVAITPSSSNIPTGATITLTATAGAGYTYVWSASASSATTQAVSPTLNTPGTYSYTVTVTDGFSCQNTSAAASVIVSDLLPGSITATDLTVCSGSVPVQITSVTAASGGSGSGYTYQWQKAEFTASNNTQFGSWTPIPSTNTAAYTPGALSVRTKFRRVVTNMGISEESNEVDFQIDALPTSISASANPSIVAPGGLSTLSVAQTYSNYSWNTTPVQTGQSISVSVPSGGQSYIVTVTDQNGCQNTATVTVTTAAIDPGTIQFTGGGTSINRCVGQALPIIAEATQATGGGNGNYVYNWQSSTDNVTFTDVAGATGTTLTLATQQTAQTVYYKRGVRDANAQTSAIVYTPAVTLNVRALPTVAITPSSSNIPTGATITLTATAGAGYTYVWSASASSATTQAVSPTLNTPGTYSYTVTVTDGFSCQNTSAAASVIVSDLLPGSITATDLTVCSGSVPVQITSVTAASGGSGSGYTYQWQKAEFTASNNTQFGSWTPIPSTNTAAYTPGALSVRTKFRRVVTNMGISEESNEVDFQIDALPTSISASANPSIVAPGGLSTLSVAQTYSNYSWNTTPVQTGQSISVSVPSGGQSYIVTVTDQNGCQNTATVTVTTAAIDPGTIQFTGGGTSINRCVGQALPIIAEATQATGGGNGNYVYNWQSSTDNVTFTDVAGATGTTLTLATQQTAQTVYYKRGVRDANAQTSAIVYTPAVTLNVRALPTVAITPSSSNIPTGATITLTATAGAGYTYVWSASASSATTQAVSPTLNTPGTYSYTVTVTDGFSCQNTSAAASVIVSDLLPGSITATDLTVCSGSVPVQITSVTAASGGSGSGYTYQWQKAEFTASNNTQFGSWTPIPSTNTAAYTPGALSVRTKFRRVVTNMGISEESNEVDFQIDALPTSISASANPSIVAPGGLSTLSVAQTYSNYSWNTTPVQTGQSISVSVPSGGQSYIVTVTDQNGCQNTATVTVTTAAIDPGTIQFTGGGTSINRCVGQALPIIAEATQATGGGNGNYVYNWQSSTDNVTFTDVAGATGTTLTLATQQTAQTVYYKRGVRDANAQTSAIVYTPAVTLNVRALPTVAITPSSSNIPTGATITLTATAGAGYTYVWSASASSATTQAVSPTLNTPGTYSYTVTVTDGFSCQNTSAAASVIVSDLLPGSITATDLTVCSGSVPVQITSVTAASGGSGSGYTYQWQKAEFTASNNTQFGSWTPIPSTNTAAYTPGALSVRTKFRRVVTNMGISEESNEVDFQIDALPTSISASANPSIVAPGGLSTLSVAQTYSNYSWNTTPVQTGQSISVSVPSGGQSYIVTVTDQNGCQNTATVTVTTAAIDPGTIQFTGGGTSINRCVGQALPIIAEATQATGGGNGNYVYNWQSSTDNVTFTDVAGATGTTLTLATQQTAQTVYYKRGVRDANAQTSAIVYTPAVTLNVRALPTVAITPSSSNIPTGATITLTATAGAGYTYVWSASASSATTQAVSPTLNTPGTYSYTVTVTDGFSCQNTSAAASVIVSDLLPGSITATDLTVCSGSVPVQITSVTAASGGSGSGYTYQWQKAEFTASNNTQFGSWTPIPSTNTAAYTPGALSVRTKFRRVVTNMGISEESNEVDFQIDALPTSISASANPSIVAPGGLSTLSVAQTYSNYSWNTTPVQTGQSISVSVPSGGQSYIVTVTDQNGCQNTATVTVTTAAIDPGTIQFTGGGTSINRCVGQALPIIAEATQATGGGNGNYVYNWQSSTDNVTFTDVAGATGTTLTLATQQTAQTVYYKRGVRDANAQTSAIVYTPAVTLNVRALPTVAITPSSSNIPTGATITLTATAGAGYTYVWSASASSATTQAVSPTLNTPGTYSYTVTVTDGFSCQNTSAAASVIVSDLLPGSITATDLTVCSGSVPVQITSVTAASGGSGSGYTYQWQKAEFTASNNTQFGSWTPIPSTNTAAYTPGALSVRTKFRRVVTNMGISEESNEVDFQIDALPTSISASANPSIVAPGGLSTLSVAQTYSNYSWNTTPVQTGQSISVSVPSGGQSYIVTVTDQNGCQNTATVTVTTAAIDPGTIQFTGGGTSINRCVGQALPIIAEATQATGGGNGNYVYNWQSSTDNVTFTDVAGATGTTLTLATQQTAQTVYYKRGVRDANAQTSAIVYTPAVTLNVRALPTVAITPSSSNIPTGATITLTATAGAGYTYVWSASASSATTQAVSPTLNTPGTYSYTVTVTDGFSCQNTSAAASVIVSDLLPGSITATDLTVCSGSVPVQITSVTAASGGSGSGYTYQWQKAEFTASTNTAFGSWTPIPNTNTAAYTPGALSVRTKFRRVVTNVGISEESNEVDFQIDALPLIVTNDITASPSTVAPGGSSILTVTPSSSQIFTAYSWNTSPVQTGQSISVSVPSGGQTYEVTVTNQNGCQNKASKTVTTANINAGELSANDNTICIGQPLPQILGTQASGGGGFGTNYSYQWQKLINGVWTNISGATSQNYTPNENANQNVSFRRQVNNTGGVAFTSAFTFTAIPLPQVQITAASQTIAPGGTLALTAQGADTWLWYSGATAASVNINTSGSYYVTGTSTATSCTNKDTIQITEVALTPGVITGNQDFCIGNASTDITGTLPTGGSGSGYNYMWQIWNGTRWVDTNPLKTGQNLENIGVLNGTTRYRRLDSDSTAPTTWYPTNEVTKTIRPNPDAQNIVITSNLGTTVPLGASVNFTASGAASYRWNSFANSTTNPYTNAIISNSQPIQVTAISSFGCETSKSINMVVNPLDAGEISVASSSVCNNGIPGLISSQTDGSGGTNSGLTYKWYINSVPVLGQSGATFQPVDPITSTTTYRRTVLNVGVESTDFTEVSITIAPSPQFNSVTVTPFNKITPGTTVSITAVATSTANGNINYGWAPSGGTISNGNQYTVSPNSNVTYTITATDALGCANTSTVQIEVSSINPGTISPVVGTSPVSLCRGDIPVGMELIGYSGGSEQYSFQWQEKLATASTWDDVGTNSASFAPTTAVTATMNYRVIVSDPNNTNHSRTTPIFVQTVNPRPTVTASLNKTSPIAHTSSIQITGLGAQTYTFRLNQTTTLTGSGNTLTHQPDLGSSLYWVIGSDAIGCKDTASITVVANKLIVGRQTSVHAPLCAGGALTQPIVVAPSRGGSGSFSYEWYKGISSSSINELITGSSSSLSYTDAINQTTYFKRVTLDQGQPFDSSFVTINVNAIPGSSISRSPTNTPIPDGATVVLSVAPVNGGSYVWSPAGGTANGTSYTVSPTTTTNYSVTVTDASGCSSTNSINILVDPLDPGSLNNQALCDGQAPSPITGDPVTGGDPSSYVYSWQSRVAGTSTWSGNITGANGASYTPNPIPTVTTEYQRTISNLGVVKTAAATVTVATSPGIVISPSTQTINLGDPATLTATGASTYTWTSPAETTASIQVNPTVNTSYTVTGEDLNGCTGTSTATVTVNLNAGSIATANDLICQGAIPGLFTELTTPTGGSGLYTFQWEQLISGSNTWTPISGATNPSFAPVQAINTTRFYRRITSDGLVSAPSNVITINTVTKPNIVATANLMTIPPGATVQLSGDGAGAGNTSYQWFIGSNSIDTTQQVAVNPSVTTSYILEGTSNEGCKNRDTIVVNVSALLGGNISAVSNALCVGNSGVTINSNSAASGGSGGGYSYAWEVSTDGGATYVAIPGQSFTSLTYTDILNGTTRFKRKATDNGIVQYSNEVIVNVNPLPNILASTSTRKVPPGVTVVLSASGGTNYSWSPLINFTGTSNTGPTVSTEVTNSTVYTVEGSDPATGCVNQDTILITVRPLVGGQIGLDQFICSGGQPGRINSLTGASGGSGAYQYRWEHKTPTQGIWQPIISATGTTYIPPTQTENTIYRRVVIDMGVETPSNEVLITVSPNPNAPVTKDTTFCQSSNFSLQVSTRVTVSSGNSLRWYESATGGIANLNSPIYTGSTVGVSEYFVSQANSTTGCESIRRKVSITTRALPNQPVVQAEQYYCEGALSPLPMSATLNSQNNSLVWFDSDGTTRLSSAPTPNTGVSMQKTYFVSEVDQFGCSSPRSQTKSIVYRPDVSITLNQEVSCFGGQNGQLTAVPSGGLAPYTYQWSKNSSAIPGADQSVLQGQGTGNYQIRATDARSCSHTATRSLTQPSDIQIVATPQNPFCYGDNGSITLTASGGTPVYQYSFDNGVTYQASNSKALPFGNYRVKVRDSRGCEKSYPANPITLVQPNAISSTFDVTNVSCWGASDGTLKVNATGGNSTTFSYLWNDPNFQTTQTASGLDSGTYSVTVYDAVGCNRTFTRSVGTPKQIKVTAVSKQDLTCFNNSTGQISITATGGNLLSYRLNTTTAAPNNTFTGLAAAEYTVTVSDSKNCFVNYQVPRTVILTQPNQLVVQSINKDSVSCRNYSDGEIEIVALGGNVKRYSINNGSSYSLSSLFTNLAAGTYTISVTDDKNCPASYTGVNTTQVVGQPSTLLVTAINKTDLSCKNSSDGQISVVASGGNAKRYSLSGTNNLQASPTFTGLTAGLKTVTVTDVKNCPVTYNTSQVVNLTEPDSLLVTAVSSSDVTCKNSQNGTISITATGGNVKTYKVNPSSTVFLNSALFNNLGPNTYEVSVRDSKQCIPVYKISRSVLISEPDSLIVHQVLKADVSCKDFNDATVEIVATGGNTKTYKIKNTATPQASSEFSGLASGNYFITVTDQKNCNAFYNVARSFVLTEPDSLFVDSKLVTPVSCFGFNDGSVVINAVGGTQPYQFQLGGASGSNSAQRSNVFDNLTPGSYLISMTDANSCPLYSRGSLNFDISEPDEIIVQSVLIDNVTCNGFGDGEILFNVTGGNSPLKFEISGDSTFVGTTSVIDSLQQGIYTFNVSDIKNCPMVMAPGLFAQFEVREPDPLIIFGINSKDITCHNFNDGVIDILATGGNAPLLFSLNGGLTYGLANSFNNLVDGIYSISATDSLGCPLVSTSQSVTNLVVDIANPAPLTSSLLISDALCHGSPNGSVEVTVAGGTLDTASSYQITWKDVNQNSVGFNPILDSVVSGIYVVEIRDDNLCLLTTQAFINQPDSIKVTGITSKDAKCYRAQDGQIQISATGGTGLLYSIDGGQTAQIPQIFAGLDTGKYSVFVTDVNSCVSYPFGPFQVIINEPDSFYVSGSIIKNADCFSASTGSILIQAAGGNQLEYTIDNGQTWQLDPLFDSLIAGIYTLDVRDSAGCIGVSTINNIAVVTEPTLLQASASVVQGVKCELEELGIANITPIGGTAPYSILWDFGDSTFLVDGLQGFEYEFTVIDSQLCTYTSTIKIPTTDADCDSIPDFDDGFDDFDGDGLPNFRDEDSDGDLLPDVIERDLNRDGIVYDDCDDDGWPNFLDVDYCTVFIPSVFTPNGDGANDLFVIPGIDEYRDNTLVIYDRNGNVVFSQAPYENGFDGMTNGTSFLNSRDGLVPTGTYYYVLTIPSIDVREIGYFYIQR